MLVLAGVESLVSARRYVTCLGRGYVTHLGDVAIPAKKRGRVRHRVYETLDFSLGVPLLNIIQISNLFVSHLSRL